MPNATAIKEKMREKNLTQASLAQKMGIATPTLSQKINGIRPMMLDEAEKLARILEIPDNSFGAYFFSS